MVSVVQEKYACAMEDQMISFAAFPVAVLIQEDIVPEAKPADQLVEEFIDVVNHLS